MFATVSLFFVAATSRKLQLMQRCLTSTWRGRAEDARIWARSFGCTGRGSLLLAIGGVWLNCACCSVVLFGGVIHSVRSSLSRVDSAVSAGAKCVGSRTMCISANARKKMIKMECETDNYTTLHSVLSYTQHCAMYYATLCNVLPHTRFKNAAGANRSRLQLRGH